MEDLTDNERVEILVGMIRQLSISSRVWLVERLVQEDCEVEKRVTAWIEEAKKHAPTLD